MKTTLIILAGITLCGIVALGIGDRRLAARTSQETYGDTMENATKRTAAAVPDDTTLRKQLTPEQYRVTRECGTEPAFDNAYWNNHRAGIYVDVITGKPLFSSTDKFDSGTGWPSFTRPIRTQEIRELTDRSHGMVRTEVTAATSGSHLGHVFNDGPKPAGMRYCINSAALRFVPVEEMQKEGYGDLLALVTGKENAAAKRTETATFAAGCFWHVEEAFRQVPGVVDTTVGYTGGHVKNPTYEQVCTHTTGHVEAVRVVYDPSRVSYDELLAAFWRMHDPTTPDRQGPDVGPQYRSVIFYHTPAQKAAAVRAKEALEKSGKYHAKIVTHILPAVEFTRAEEYHQRYLEKQGRGSCALP
jgi:peptide methionine sulfoxide reductase msrA/msrB